MKRASLTFGEAHPFWDVYMGEDVYEDAEVDREDMSSISVMVDEATGEVELNAGYEPGSTPHRQETSLFAEVEADVTEALVRMMHAGRLEDPAYDAFRAKHSGPTP